MYAAYMTMIVLYTHLEVKDHVDDGLDQGFLPIDVGIGFLPTSTVLHGVCNRLLACLRQGGHSPELAKFGGKAVVDGVVAGHGKVLGNSGVTVFG
jgi:hypothetical protein